MTSITIPSDLLGPLASSVVALSVLIPIIAYLLSTSPKLRTTTHTIFLTLLRGFAYTVGYFTIALTIIPITTLYYVDLHWDTISPWNLIYGRGPTDIITHPPASRRERTNDKNSNNKETIALESDSGRLEQRKTRRSDSVGSNISNLDLGDSVIQDSEDDSAVDLSLGDERAVGLS